MTVSDLQRLMDDQNWLGILAHEQEIIAAHGTNAERAFGLYTLGYAYWCLRRDAWECKVAVQYLQQATQLDHLHGKALKALGAVLITIGYYQQGRHALQTWLSRFPEWTSDVQACLADVQYSMGYAARYEGDLAQSEQWYMAARNTYSRDGNIDWVWCTNCNLAQVQARNGRPASARATLNLLAEDGPFEAYRLKALVEVLVAEGYFEDALTTGERASEALLDLADPDPWELAELHITLADLHQKTGNQVERDKHLQVASDALSISPRHTLYAVARSLLEGSILEVSA